jgi:hypothetical protein
MGNLRSAMEAVEIMHLQTRMVMFAFVVIIMVALVSPDVAASGQRCTTCHSGSNPSSGYAISMPRLSFSCPVAAPPNWTFSITLELFHPGHYELRDPRATLTVSGDGGLLYPESAQKSLSPLSASGGSSKIRWNISTGNSTGTLSLVARLNFTAHHGHASHTGDNDGHYALVEYGEITVRPMGLFATEGELALKGKQLDFAAFELVSCPEATNISLKLSENLKGVLDITTAVMRNLSAGQRQAITMDVEDASRPVNNGRIDITWENASGVRDATFIVVRLQGAHVPPPPAGSSPLRLTGRMTGMLSLGLLMASICLGFIRRGGRRIVRLHCAVSWFIIGLSVYHGLMLVVGPYSRFVWGNLQLLGYASAVVMGVSGANGLLQRWMSKRIGHSTWIWMHRITIMLAVVLVSIHAIALGTDFAFVRDPLLGRDP